MLIRMQKNILRFLIFLCYTSYGGLPIISHPFPYTYTTKEVDTHTFVSVYFHFEGADARTCSLFHLPLFIISEVQDGEGLLRVLGGHGKLQTMEGGFLAVEEDDGMANVYV